MAELSEAQFLWLEAQNILEYQLRIKKGLYSLRGGLDLYFGSGGEGYVTGGVGVLSLLLRCLNSHQSREGCSEVTT